MKLQQAHQALLQFFMIHGVANEKVLIDQFAMIDQLVYPLKDNRQDGEKPNFKDAIAKINLKLQSLGLQITGHKSEHNKKPYWGIVNDVDDVNSQMATQFSAHQIAFYRMLVTTILEGDGTVDDDKVEEFRTHDDVKLSGPQCKQVLNDLTAQRWLKKGSDRGIFMLGERAYLELRHMLEKMADNGQLPKCPVCNQYCVLGSQDPDDEMSRTHKYCARAE